MKTASSSNQKGGVGKTMVHCHVTFFLAESLIDSGGHLLMVDNDPQGNSTTSILKSDFAEKAPFDTIDLYSDDFITDFKPTKPITVVSADRRLAKVARWETETPFIFRENLKKLSDDYKYCTIDNPPTLGLGLIAALVSSDVVYSPIELENYSIEGIKDLRKTIEGVRQRHNAALRFIGMIPNRLNSRDNRQKEKFVKLIQAFDDLIIKTPIVQRGSISQALDRGLPVWEITREVSAAKQAAVELLSAVNFIKEKIEEKGVA